MPKLNSCPLDRGHLEFYGISRHPTGYIDHDTLEPIIDHFRWQQCSTCGVFTKETFYGQILLTQKLEPDKAWFRVPRDD